MRNYLVTIPHPYTGKGSKAIPVPSRGRQNKAHAFIFKCNNAAEAKALTSHALGMKKVPSGTKVFYLVGLNDYTPEHANQLSFFQKVLNLFRSDD